MASGKREQPSGGGARSRGGGGYGAGWDAGGAAKTLAEAQELDPKVNGRLMIFNFFFFFFQICYLRA